LLVDHHLKMPAGTGDMTLQYLHLQSPSLQLSFRPRYQIHETPVGTECMSNLSPRLQSRSLQVPVGTLPKTPARTGCMSHQSQLWPCPILHKSSSGGSSEVDAETSTTCSLLPYHNRTLHPPHLINTKRASLWVRGVHTLSLALRAPCGDL
jgi:hypothetical protein